MRFRFFSDTNQQAFIDHLEDTHFGWSYGRQRKEIFTGKLPDDIVDVARQLGADIDE